MNFWQKVKHGLLNPTKAGFHLIYAYIHWLEKKEILNNLKVKTAQKWAAHKYYSEIGSLLNSSQDPYTESVIDLGCGPGRYTSLLISLGYKVTGSDLNQYDQWSYFNRHEKNCQFDSNINAESSPYADNQFHHGVCIGTLFYCDHPEKVIAEISRIVKPSGKILISTINSKSNHNNASKVSKTAANIDDLENLLLEHGLKITKKFYYGYAPAHFKRVFSILYYGFIPKTIYDWMSRMTAPEFRPVVVFHCLKVKN